jgi:hypothetical protein
VSKGGATAPPSVNAAGLIGQQAGSNIQAAQTQAALNNANVISPLGQSGWAANSYDPNTGLPTSYTQSQYLSPQAGNVFNAQTGLASGLANNANTVGNYAAGTAGQGSGLVNQAINTWGGQLPTSPVSTEGLPALTGSAAAGPIQTSVNQVSNAAGGPIQNSLDFSGLTALPSSSTDFSNEVTAAQNAAYNTQAGYLDPQFAERRSDLAQQLADQGISAGSSAFDRSQGDLGRQQTFAYQQAQNAAVAAGNEEQARLFGENLSSRQQGVGEREAQGQFANQAQAQGFGQNLTNAELANQAALAQGNFANQAQQQGFGQNYANANLSNAANLQGFNERTTQWGEPLAALSGLAGLGEGLLGGSAGQLAGLGSLGNFTWAGGLPSQGGTATTVTPPNIAGLQGAANQGNLNSFVGGNTLNNQLFSQLGGLANAAGGSNLLFGSQGLGGLLGVSPTSGLLGALLGGGADALGGGATAAAGLPLGLAALGLA